MPELSLASASAAPASSCSPCLMGLALHVKRSRLMSPERKSSPSCKLAVSDSHISPRICSDRTDLAQLTSCRPGQLIPLDAPPDFTSAFQMGF